jgi:hypothetical protein
MSRLANRLLASLSPKEYQRVSPLLRTLRLNSGGTLPHCGVGRVYFPNTGVASILSRMADGTSIEVASVGTEGVVGLPALGSQLSAATYLHVAHGSIQYMSISIFDSLCVRSELGRAVEQYCARFMEGVMQLSACSRLHSTDARCARWILLTYERLHRARFELTQSCLAMMLGVKPDALRPFMARLAEAKIVKHDAATVTVLDAIGLRRLACSCYSPLKKHAEVPRVQNKPTPRAPRARVVSMRSVSVCTICGLIRDYPHQTHMECLRAIDREIHDCNARARVLVKIRARLTAQAFEKYEKFLSRKES